MPAIYAHHRFGNLILPGLPADVRGAIMRNRSLFDAGLQGPDFLFYYKPTAKNPVYALAREITDKRLIERNIPMEKLQDHPMQIKSQFQQNRERKENKAAIALQRTLEKMKQQNKKKKD